MLSAPNANSKDGDAGPSQHGILLPAQYFPAQRKHAPEQRLMIAVLHDAVECLEKHRFAPRPRDQVLFHETRQWFLTVDGSWPYSFECICGVLDLDCDAIRQRLQLTGAEIEASPTLSHKGARP